MVRDRRAFLRVRRAVVTIQAHTRGMYTRRIYWEVRVSVSVWDSSVLLTSNVNWRQSVSTLRWNVICSV